MPMGSTDPQRHLLALPGRAGAAAIARGQLEQVCDAAARLHGADDDGSALHDFRVGLRRLRSTLRTYERVLYDWVGPAWHRRIAAVARLTNAARDAEVQLLWLRGHVEALPVEHRPVVDMLSARLDDDGDATIALRRRIFERFADIELALSDLLAPRSERVDDGPAFASVAAERLRELARSLQQRLTRITPTDSPKNADRIHRARIAGKRLRYALEPLRNEVPAAVDLVATLKSFQDVGGRLNDQHLLAQQLERARRKATRRAERRSRKHQRAGEAPATPPAPAVAAGIALLHELLATERSADLERLHRLWLGDGSAPFFAAVTALADDLATPAD